jgi:hypothetical protein
MVTMPAVLLARAQEAPARVIVTTPLEPVAVAVQFEKPPLKVIVGVGGTVNKLLKVTVMVLPIARCPVLLVVKPTAQEAVAPAVCGVPAKVTAVTAVPAEVIVWPRAGFVAVVSVLVLTLNSVLA